MIGAWTINPHDPFGGTSNGSACTSVTIGSPSNPFTQNTFSGTLTTITWSVRFSDGSVVTLDADSLIDARAQAENLARWLPRVWGAPEREVIGVTEV
jgi:hypothetical protein